MTSDQKHLVTDVELQSLEHFSRMVMHSTAACGLFWAMALVLVGSAARFQTYYLISGAIAAAAAGTISFFVCALYRRERRLLCKAIRTRSGWKT